VTSLSTAPPVTTRPSFALDVLAIAIALLGGAFGVFGAFVQEFQAGGGILLAFAGAPIIEEALKPAGIYLLLARWPQALRGQLHTAMLTALAGVTFGLIESVIYVTLYYPEGGDGYVLFRFTIPVGLHAIASLVVGLGLSRSLIDWANGQVPLPKSARNFYIAGVLIHAIYNTSAVVVGYPGAFD
jgi:hypothetical protein